MDNETKAAFMRIEELTKNHLGQNGGDNTENRQKATFTLMATSLEDLGELASAVKSQDAEFARSKAIDLYSRGIMMFSLAGGPVGEVKLVTSIDQDAKEKTVQAENRNPFEELAILSNVVSILATEVMAAKLLQEELQRVVPTIKSLESVGEKEQTTRVNSVANAYLQQASLDLTNYAYYFYVAQGGSYTTFDKLLSKKVDKLEKTQNARTPLVAANTENDEQ